MAQAFGAAPASRHLHTSGQTLDPALAPPPAPVPSAPNKQGKHLMWGDSARMTLSRGPLPSFRVTSCRFSMARAAEEARSYLTYATPGVVEGSASMMRGGVGGRMWHRGAHAVTWCDGDTACHSSGGVVDPGRGGEGHATTGPA